MIAFNDKNLIGITNFMNIHRSKMDIILHKWFNKEDVTGSSTYQYKLGKYYAFLYLCYMIVNDFNKGFSYLDVWQKYNLTDIEKKLNCIGINLKKTLESFGMTNDLKLDIVDGINTLEISQSFEILPLTNIISTYSDYNINITEELEKGFYCELIDTLPSYITDNSSCVLSNFSGTIFDEINVVTPTYIFALFNYGEGLLYPYYFRYYLFDGNEFVEVIGQNSHYLITDSNFTEIKVKVYCNKDDDNYIQYFYSKYELLESSDFSDFFDIYLNGNFHKKWKYLPTVANFNYFAFDDVVELRSPSSNLLLQYVGHNANTSLVEQVLTFTNESLGTYLGLSYNDNFAISLFTNISSSPFIFKTIGANSLGIRFIEKPIIEDDWNITKRLRIFYGEFNTDTYETYQWYKNNAIITGAISNTLSITDEDYYFCVCTKNGITQKSDSYHYVATTPLNFYIDATIPQVTSTVFTPNVIGVNLGIDLIGNPVPNNNFYTNPAFFPNKKLLVVESNLPTVTLQIKESTTYGAGFPVGTVFTFDTFQTGIDDTLTISASATISIEITLINGDVHRVNDILLVDFSTMLAAFSDTLSPEAPDMEIIPYLSNTYQLSTNSILPIQGAVTNPVWSVVYTEDPLSGFVNGINTGNVVEVIGKGIYRLSFDEFFNTSGFYIVNL